MNSFLKAQKIVKECKRLKLLIKATDTKRSIRFHSVIYTIKKQYSTTSLYTCWGEAFWQEDILDIVDKFIKENLK